MPRTNGMPGKGWMGLLVVLVCVGAWAQTVPGGPVAPEPAPLPDDQELFLALERIIEALPGTGAAPEALVDEVTGYLEACREWYGLITVARREYDPKDLVETLLGTTCVRRRALDFCVARPARYPRSYWLMPFLRFTSSVFMEYEDGVKAPYRAWGMDSCEELSCVCFSSFNKWGKGEQFALVQKEEEGWQGVEYLAYPNGKPRELSYWCEGKLAAACTWNLDGTCCVSNGGSFPAALAQLHPETPISAYAGDGLHETCPIASCSVYVHFESANSAEADGPCMAVHVGRAGSPMVVAAPEISRYTFLGWSGDVESQDASLTIEPQGHMRLTAHYGGEFQFVYGKFGNAVRKAMGLEEEVPLSHADLADVHELDLSGMGGSRAETSDLFFFRNLETLDLSGSQVWERFLPSPVEVGGEYLWCTKDFPGHAPLNRLLFALANTRPYVLRTLCLDESLLETRGPAAQFPESLKSLSMRGCGLVSTNCLRGLTQLESLVLDENPFWGDAPLFPRLGALRNLSLKGCRFSAIEALPEDAGERPGLCVNLEENPLSEKTLNEAVPRLREQGMTVLVSGEVSAEPGGDDFDGDGYTNEDERRFVSLFYADREEVRKAYEAAIHDPDTPRHYLEVLPESAKVKIIREGKERLPVTDLMSIDAIPTESVTIFITEGFGELYPGDGEHPFAKYIVHDDGTWDFNEVEFRAVPGEGWQIRPPMCYEQSDGLVKWDATEAVWRVSIEDRPESLTVGFVEILDTDLHLYADYERFIAEFCSGEDPLRFDLNTMDMQFKEDGSRVDTPKGDGIPDGAQIRQIAAYLADPDFQQDARGGAYRFEIVEPWKENLDRAAAVLGEAGKERSYLVHVLAAYALMSGDDGARALKALIEAKLKTSIDCSGFNEDMFYRYLGGEECATVDSTCNEDVWAEVSRGYEPSLEVFDLFVEKTLHPRGRGGAKKEAK